MQVRQESITIEYFVLRVSFSQIGGKRGAGCGKAGLRLSGCCVCDERHPIRIEIGLVSTFIAFDACRNL